MSFSKRLLEKQAEAQQEARTEARVLFPSTISTTGAARNVTICPPGNPSPWRDYETTITMSRQQLQEDLEAARAPDQDEPSVSLPNQWSVSLSDLGTIVCSTQTPTVAGNIQFSDPRMDALVARMEALENKLQVTEAKLASVESLRNADLSRICYLETRLYAMPSPTTQNYEQMVKDNAQRTEMNILRERIRSCELGYKGLQERADAASMTQTPSPSTITQWDSSTPPGYRTGKTLTESFNDEYLLTVSDPDRIAGGLLSTAIKAQQEADLRGAATYASIDELGYFWPTASATTGAATNKQMYYTSSDTTKNQLSRIIGATSPGVYFSE